MNNKLYQSVLSLINECIDLSEYKQDNNLLNLKSVFDTEMGHMVRRVGLQKALSEWIRGLPSTLSFPFHNYEQKEILESWSKFVITEEREELNYWETIAEVLAEEITKQLKGSYVVLWEGMDKPEYSNKHTGEGGAFDFYSNLETRHKIVFKVLSHPSDIGVLNNSFNMFGDEGPRFKAECYRKYSFNFKVI